MSSWYQTKFSWPISRKGDTTCRDNQRTDYDQWKVNDSTAQWYAATCLVEIYINSMEYLFCFFGSQSHVCDKTRRCVSPFHYQAQNLPSFLFCLCTWCLKHYWSQQFAGGMSYITIVIKQVTVESLQLSGRVSECRFQRSEVQMLMEHQNFCLPTLMTWPKKCLFLYFGFPICVSSDVAAKTISWLWTLVTSQTRQIQWQLL